MKRNSDQIDRTEEGEERDITELGPFLASPYTIHSEAREVKKHMTRLKEEFLHDYRRLPCFPWLLQDLGKDFSEADCQRAWYNAADDSKAGRTASLVEYMNRFFCHILDESGPDRILKKSWDHHSKSFVLVEKVNFATQVLKACAVNPVTQNENGQWVLVGGKAINPAQIWLSSQERRRYKKREFAPDDYEALMDAMERDDLDLLSDVATDQLNKFTGWGVDPRIAKSFLNNFYKHSFFSLEEAGDKNKLHTDAHYGFCHAVFVDRSSPEELKRDWPLGTILTGYMDFYGGNPSPLRVFVPGPPHPDNRRYWPDHAKALMDIARNYRHLRYLVGGDPDAPIEVQMKHLLMYFGRPGDPWGDCGFSIAPWLEFIYRAICSSDMTLYDYLLSWSASLIKRVGKPLSSTLCLYNQRNGGGKSSFMGMLISIIGDKWCWTTSEPNDIVGDFTAAAADKVLVFLDEVKFSRSARSQQMSNLKNLLTNKQVRVHRKGIDVAMERRFLNVCMATNEKNFLTASLKERRHCTVEINDEVNGQNHYLSSLYNMMRGSGRCYPRIRDKKVADDDIGLGLVHFAAFLNNWDVEDWTEWPVPKTGLLFHLQMDGWNTVARWWYQKLINGEFYPKPEFCDMPIESSMTKHARDMLIASAVWGNGGPDDLVDKLRDFSKLTEKYYTNIGQMTDGELKKYVALNNELEQSRAWNPLWPKSVIHDMYVREMRATGSNYGVLDPTQFSHEFYWNLVFRDKRTAHSHSSKRTVCEPNVPEGPDLLGSRFAAPMPGDEMARRIVDGDFPGIRVNDLNTKKYRTLYTTIPSLDACRKSFCEALQLEDFPPELLWPNDRQMRPDIASESNAEDDPDTLYMTKPWTRYAFWNSVSQKTIDRMIEGTMRWRDIHDEKNGVNRNRREPLPKKKARTDGPSNSVREITAEEMDAFAPSDGEESLDLITFERLVRQSAGNSSDYVEVDRSRDKGKEKVTSEEEIEEGEILEEEEVFDLPVVTFERGPDLLDDLLSQS